MKKSKTITIILFCMFFFAPRIGWTEEKSSPVRLLAANYKIKRSINASDVNLTKKYAIIQPDLSIENMKWSIPLKQGYIVGQNSILNFTLKNKGAGSSGNFSIKFTCPNCPPSMNGIHAIPSLAPGASYSGNWPSIAAVPEKWDAGPFMIAAMILPNRIIKDSNRSNNRKIMNFVVQGSSNLKKKLVIRKKKNLTDNLSEITAGKRIVSGFNFSTQHNPGTTGKRIVIGFDFSAMPEPGTTGKRIVSGFNFSTQPALGTTGMRTVQGFNFIKQ
jgi:hypothetical protein